MSEYRSARPVRDPNAFARSRDDERARNVVQNGRAARTVAGRAVNAEDCQSLLAMLGLEPADGRSADPSPLS